MLLLKDIDECQDPSTCDHNCTNKKGSFTCSCAVGYRLGNDGKSCTGTECVSIFFNGTTLQLSPFPFIEFFNV